MVHLCPIGLHDDHRAIVGPLQVTEPQSTLFIIEDIFQRRRQSFISRTGQASSRENWASSAGTHSEACADGEALQDARQGTERDVRIL